MPNNQSEKSGALKAGYEQALRDLQDHWWDSNNNIPRIRPTRGSNSSATAMNVGTAHNNAAAPSFWQMAMFANVQYWDWKISHSEIVAAQIGSQWDYIRSVFSEQALSSADKSFGLINVSDDAAWALNYLLQVHEVTGDPRALADAVAMLPSVLDRFADPNAPRVRYGRLQASPYGILYATARDDPDHQGCSTTFESMMANSAVYIYQQSHNADYLHYAIGTYDWTRKYLKHPTRGYYYCELDIRPTINGEKNPHFLVPMGDYFGPPVRGLSSSYSGGTMAVAVLAARLFNITKDPQYLDEARKIAADYVRGRAFLRPGYLFVNDRDAWTDGYWAPYFADEVLILPGVDESGLWKRAIRDTAFSIISQRTRSGFYGADWSGPERNPNGGSMTWEEQARQATGSGAGMALPKQIMTSSDSVAMVSAAIVADHRFGSVAAPVYFVGRFSEATRDGIGLLEKNKFRYQTHGVDSSPAQVGIATLDDADFETAYFVGNFTGLGRNQLAFRRGNAIYYQTKGLGSDGQQMSMVHFGEGDSEDQYLVGDFAGIGRDGLAVRRGNKIIFQTDGITSGPSQVDSVTFGAGEDEDEYLVGDFTGIGRDELAVRRGNQIIYQTDGIQSDAVATVNFGKGEPQRQYLVGDFSAIGHDELAVRQENKVVYEKGGIANTSLTGTASLNFDEKAAPMTQHPNAHPPASNPG